jgi:nucleoside-diphosphate-sugar epimerase
MSILIIGGTGFIGRRLIPLLVKRGEEIVCMDINPQTANYGEFGKQVRVVRGDVTQFDDVVAQMAAVHNATMVAARRLAHVETIEQQDSASRITMA